MADPSQVEKNKPDDKRKPVDAADGHPPTSYFETIIHLFKGNIGPGLFAMGDAFKNGGMIVSPILTVLIAITTVHCQHLLLKCAKKVQEANPAFVAPDYAETAVSCFDVGPQKIRKWAPVMGTAVNIFICVTQLGFCCIYFVFISTNLKQILNNHGFYWNSHLIMLLAFVPILLSALITNLKYLAPVSFVANCGMVGGLVITMYFAFKDGLPSITEREYYTNGPQLALYFGTCIFAFEGIALVLPLKNAMKKPKHFDKKLGVLNVGMVLVASSFMFAGFFGYWKWGSKVGGSLTLNLGNTILAEVVKTIVSMGVLFGYALQFFVAIQIMLPSFLNFFNITENLLCAELIFRATWVFITLAIAELVPKLNLFISLVGALCSTALALVFPPIMELIVKSGTSSGVSVCCFLKNILILVVALLGFATGTWESLTQIIREFKLDI